MTMLEVRGLSKAFLGRPILHQVSFTVSRGESLVILGQSGTGKSVLLKLLAHLLSPDEGQVRIDTRNVGMLFQKNALFDSLRVSENLDFPLKERTSLSSPERAKKISQYLDWVGLSGTDRLFPDELSGGMQKRLGIARALIVEPELILYDEPTAGLDPITSRKIAELILRLQKELRTTVVAVTSDVMRAYQMATQIGLLVRSSEGSRFLLAGTPEQTRQSEHPAIQQFVQGKTEGPLTTDMLTFEPTPKSHFYQEFLDVDYF